MKVRFSGLCALIILAGLAVLAAGVQVGDPAPAFTATDQDGNSWALKDHLGSRHLVIYFYPAAMTGGCTKQACIYRDYIEGNSDLEIEIIGISGDSTQNLKYFQQAENLNFTLLADPDGSMAALFGVPVRKGNKTIKRFMDGKEVELIRCNTASRWTFIIDPAGRVVYRDTQVQAAQDLDKILVFLKKPKE